MDMDRAEMVAFLLDVQEQGRRMGVTDTINIEQCLADIDAGTAPIDWEAAELHGTDVGLLLGCVFSGDTRYWTVAA